MEDLLKLDTITVIIDELIGSMKFFNSYNRNEAMKFIILCNSIKEDGISFIKLRMINVTFNAFLSSIPTDHYEIHTKFTILFNALLNISLENKSFSIKDTLVLDVDFATNNYYEAHILSSIGMPSLAFDFEVTGLHKFLKSDDPFELDIEKIQLGIQNDIFGIRETLIQLSATFFYLARILGHTYSQAHTLYTQSKQFLFIGFDATEEDIDYLCCYGSLLCVNYSSNNANEILEVLKNQYSIEFSRNPNQAAKIAQLLTSKYAILSGESIIDWAKKALAVPKAEITLQNQVDLKLTILLSEELLKKEDVWDCLVAILKYIEDNTSDVISGNLQRQRLSNFLIRVIARAIEIQDYLFAIKCACLWRTYKKEIDQELEQLLHQTILFALPLYSSEKSVFILYHNRNFLFFEVNHQLNPEDFISIKNEFEGNWTVLLDQVTTSQPSSSGNGPIINESDRYEEAIKKMLFSDSLLKALSQVQNNEVIRILELPGLNLPLPSLYGLHSKRPVSTLVTSVPQSRTKITKVLIWCDPEGSLFDAYREKETLEYLLRKHGIYFETYYFTQCSFELFLSKYSDMNFDIVWVMCHAAFDHTDPPRSKLYVSKEQYITLRRLSMQPVTGRSNRRLMVLNACESGCGPIRYTAMEQIGFSQSLTNNFQSVIGHLWPVSSFVATIFGTLLMARLIEGVSWAEALNDVRIDIYNGNNHLERILTTILGADSQIIDSLVNRQEDLNKLVYWASSNLYE